MKDPAFLPYTKEATLADFFQKTDSTEKK
jgi:hypothetical protein